MPFRARGSGASPHRLYERQSVSWPSVVLVACASWRFASSESTWIMLPSSWKCTARWSMFVNSLYWHSCHTVYKQLVLAFLSYSVQTACTGIPVIQRTNSLYWHSCHTAYKQLVLAFLSYCTNSLYRYWHSCHTAYKQFVLAFLSYSVQTVRTGIHVIQHTNSLYWHSCHTVQTACTGIPVIQRTNSLYWHSCHTA